MTPGCIDPHLEAPTGPDDAPAGSAEPRQSPLARLFRRKRKPPAPSRLPASTVEVASPIKPAEVQMPEAPAPQSEQEEQEAEEAAAAAASSASCSSCSD
ncbi:MAG: hypothetical protein EOO75_11330, partial [Myxococcales bacterium]